MITSRKSRLSTQRVGKSRQFVLYLSERGTKVLTLKVGRSETPFFTFVVRCCANGIALGIAFWSIQASIGYTDMDYPDQPVLQYGIYWREVLALYLPRRYVLWGE